MTNPETVRLSGIRSREVTPEREPDKRPLRMHGRDPRILDALKQAGIIRENDYVRRVIIDINAADAVVVYIERYGDERLLDVIRTLDGAEIRGVPGPAGDEEKP